MVVVVVVVVLGFWCCAAFLVGFVADKIVSQKRGIILRGAGDNFCLWSLGCESGPNRSFECPSVLKPPFLYQLLFVFTLWLLSSFYTKCFERTPESLPILFFISTSMEVKIEAQHVVITSSLGALKAAELCFEPPLPEAKRRSIQRLGFGTVNKACRVWRFYTTGVM